MMRLIFAFCIIGWGLASCNMNDPYAEGKGLYERHCANCHMDDGSGLEGLIPPLAKADMLQTLGASAACLIRNGVSGKMVVNGVTYEGEMPANERLSEVEILNILNYINNSWGNQREFIKLDEVKQSLNPCK